MYRTLDGTCNNLDRPMLGAAFRRYIRHMPPRYDDNIGEPICKQFPRNLVDSLILASLKATRPSSREANRVMLSSSQSVIHDKVGVSPIFKRIKVQFQFNNLMMQWGQFMSHDMAKTTLQPSAQCTTCSPVKSKCMPVVIDDKDPNLA